MRVNASGGFKTQTFLITFLKALRSKFHENLTNGLYASTKTDSRTKVVSTQTVHFLIPKDCLIITKISNLKNSTLCLLFTVFLTKNKNI